MATVALVNNMPDTAFSETEEQFRRLVFSSLDGHDVTLKLYTIAEVPRSSETAAAIRERYRGLWELWDDPPDALIVTGTEPTQVRLSYEPYWASLARLLEWASEAVPTTMLSCLAAHASLSLFDGIERVPRRVKASGVYAGRIQQCCSPLTAGLPELIAVPHSRVNDVPESAMLAAGYNVVVSSADFGVGWSVATRECGGSLFVLCQGHPEYSRLSLLREYRRDVRRHLFGRGLQPYPQLPQGYLDPTGEERLLTFAERVKDPRADSRELWDAFPYSDVAAGVSNTWAEGAAILYRNWLREGRIGLPAPTAAASV